MKTLLRNIRLTLGKGLLDTAKPLTTPIQAKKILFLRHDGKIGDYIVSSFVFRELKKQDPNIHISVICSHKNAYLFERNPYIDQLYFVKTRHLIDYIKCGLKLRKIGFDLIIDPTVLLRNRDLLLLRLINAKTYVGYKKENYQLFNLNITDPNLHFSDIYKQALELIGFQNIDNRYDMPNDPQSQQEIQQFLQQQHLSSFICINFFGASRSRSFNEEKIQQFLQYLTALSNKNFVILTTPEKTEWLKKLISPYSNIYLYANTSTIFHSIELIRYSDGLISPDTATIHIAAGFSKKIIGFYSAINENFANWHPNNRNVTEIIRYQKNINELDPKQILDKILTIF